MVTRRRIDDTLTKKILLMLVVALISAVAAMYATRTSSLSMEQWSLEKSRLEVADADQARAIADLIIQITEIESDHEHTSRELDRLRDEHP